MQTHTINIPDDMLRVLHQILDISHKAHKNNASPVDIKLELASIPEGPIVLLKNKISEFL